MDAGMQPNSRKKSLMWLWIIVTLAILAGGIWYVAGNKKNVTINSNSVAINLNGSAPLSNRNSNTNTSTFSGNANAGGSSMQLFQGNGFTVRYPNGWIIIQEPGLSPWFTPKNTTFYFEGSVDYPISVSTIKKGADDYVSVLPPTHRTRVTINGYAGYQARANCPTCGDSPFYIFSLAGGRSSVIVGYMGDVLEQTAGDPIDYITRREVFEQMAHSIQIQ